MPDQVLDVRPLSPRDRHPSIFNVLDHLHPGEHLRLLNDHDPSPLHYQILATRPGLFRWSPVEQGPEVWQVEITRL